jgi:hypothetical protein
MLGWFKKRKAPELSPELKALTERFIGPQALAVAITEAVRDYVNAVKAGNVEYPAHRRKNTNVQSVWNDVRLEALHKMFNFGQADLMLLGDMKKQLALLNCFLDERPYLEMPQPRGQQMADTLQGIWQVYLYLNQVGSELADPLTDNATLKSRGRNILSDFVIKAEALRMKWTEFDRARKAGGESLPEIPDATITVFWADVTAKCKSIALSQAFGPMHESGIQYMLKLVAEKGNEQDVAKVKASLERVRAAKEPEDIR